MRRNLRNLRRLAEIIIFWLAGCATSKPPVSPVLVLSAEACRHVIDSAITAAHTCPEAELVINSNETCHALYPGGLHLKCSENQ